MSRLKIFPLVSFILLAMFLFVGTASADGPPPGIDPAQPRYGWGPYVPSKMQEPPDEDQSQAESLSQSLSVQFGRSRATAGDCIYDMRVVNPHPSGDEVSVHGWWEVVGNSTCPSRAQVTTVLQGVWCDFWVGACWWEQANKNEGNIRPGGGSGKRVTARVVCETIEQTGFRGVVDVDLPGRDPSNKAYSAPGDLPCRPANWSS